MCKYDSWQMFAVKLTLVNKMYFDFLSPQKHIKTNVISNHPKYLNTMITIISTIIIIIPLPTVETLLLQSIVYHDRPTGIYMIQNKTQTVFSPRTFKSFQNHGSQFTFTL